MLSPFSTISFVALLGLFTATLSHFSLLDLPMLSSNAARHQPDLDAPIPADRPVDPWFDDAKIGIIVHWGLYSVPGWAPPSGKFGSNPDWKDWFLTAAAPANNPYAEWYLWSQTLPDSLTSKHHAATYGPDADYYETFAPIFANETRSWDGSVWEKWFRWSGARYVVVTTKHHDGYTLFPPSSPHPQLPPHLSHPPNDLISRLMKAFRNPRTPVPHHQRLKVGLYYSGGFDWSFEMGRDVNTWGPLPPKSAEYASWADEHVRELVNRYKPDVLWGDITYPSSPPSAFVPRLLNDYFRKVPHGLVNDRWFMQLDLASAAPRLSNDETYEGDFITPEYTRYRTIPSRKWETCHGVGFSFGYNRMEDGDITGSQGRRELAISAGAEIEGFASVAFNQWGGSIRDKGVPKEPRGEH
ncbi:glycoside hydrolase family 29 protein [Gonapodya prolifera JEL478]|uniref:alpha-L-fucosidase n=1 Tax=Gonapodya prolifera (strain JEL478) TaxID=1344416 RepID=A0A139A6P7_GONPJ|nr:glycoside hydrolase family 29 protein [Gonapodya prolifera JEL478]|eukprot:KXS12441.1 glycoside hydrolase family 29 protein [Gonapodya prolifera JEL478]